MKKRMLSLVLVMVMLLSLNTMTAFAEEITYSYDDVGESFYSFVEDAVPEGTIPEGTEWAGPEEETVKVPCTTTEVEHTDACYVCSHEHDYSCMVLKCFHKQHNENCAWNCPHPQHNIFCYEHTFDNCDHIHNRNCYGGCCHQHDMGCIAFGCSHTCDENCLVLECEDETHHQHSDECSRVAWIWTLVRKTFDVTWVDEDGETVLATTEVEYGQVPVYPYDAPTKDGDAQYTYTFDKWVKVQPVTVRSVDLTAGIEEATADVTYKASYTATVNEYTVTWYDEDGETVLHECKDVPYGTDIVYDGTTPTKASTAQYSYAFDKWLKIQSEEVAPTAASEEDAGLGKVTGNVAFKASYTETINKYKVTWVDEDGKVVDTEDVEYGKDATKAPTVPAKSGYTAKWNDEGKKVVADRVIKPVYTAIPVVEEPKAEEPKAEEPAAEEPAPAAVVVAPATGDNAQFGLYLGVLAIALVGLVSAAAVKKSRR